MVAISVLVEPSRFSSSLAASLGLESLNSTTGIDWNGFDLCAGASQASCGSKVPWSIASVRSRMRAAIGNATVPPCPPCSPPCTITAIVYFGESYGAKQTNHAVVSFLPSVIACAVPVLPATCTPLKRALPPVPPSSFTTFQRPRRAISICSRLKSNRKSARTRGAEETTGCPFAFKIGWPSAPVTL